ncbi:MAG: cyclic nucleotide-binding domain-containing protein [Actinobacteria bacterium]|nr:cyclic nucleotide-binding domain-containing protein [Actinomycetota bacterium]
MTELEHVRLVTAFLARTPPFTGLTHEARERLATAIEERQVAVGDEVMVEEGAPATGLYIVRDGALELVRRGRVVDVLTSGKVLGHPSLLSGEPPELTVRARELTSLYVLPGEEALDLLSRPEGVAFVARTLRERLVRAVHAVYDEQASRAVPVSSLVERPALFCEPQLTIREAARLMSEEGVTYALIDTRAGLGIVTNTDLRDKVLAGDVSPDAPVGSIATTPVKTVRTETLAPEASIEMLAGGCSTCRWSTPAAECRG